MFFDAVIQQLQGKEKDILKKIAFLKKHILVVWVINILIFGGVLGLHSYPLYKEVMNTQKKIQIEKENIEENQEKLNEVLKELEESQKQLKEVETELGEILPRVLPPIKNEAELEQATYNLAIFFEDYALKNSYSENPFKLSNISFGGMSKEDGIIKLPVTINIEASKKNFLNFIQFITHKSGSMEEKDFYQYSLRTIEKEKVPIPAMTVNSLNLDNSEDVEEENNKVESYNVNITVYFKDEMNGIKK